MTGGARWVVCLCADWCGTCRTYRATFDALAARYPGHHFRWLDVEAAEEALGEHEIETFPTLLLAQGPSVHFLGPLLPQAGVLERLLQRMDEAPSATESGEANALWARLAPVLLPTLPGRGEVD